MPCSSLTEIVRRHETLHTFPIVNGSAVQVIAHKQTVKVPVVDLRQLPEERSSLRLCDGWLPRKPIYPDLALGPLLQPPLLQVEKESHVLLVTMPHRLRWLVDGDIHPS